MIQNETRLAVVSPLDGVCGWLHRASNSVTIVVPVEQAGKVVAIGNYLKKYPDSTISEFADESELLSNLMEAKNKTVALDFSLALFDVAYSEPLRRKISAELDNLLTAKTTRDYVLDVMLSVPLPEELDVTTTLSYAGESSRVKELLKLIVDFQPRVRVLRNAWLAQHSVSASDPQQFRAITSAMVRLGIFRELVLCRDSNADLEGLKSRILLDKSIAEQCGTEIPIAFVDRFATQLSGTQGLELKPVIFDPEAANPETATAQNTVTAFFSYSNDDSGAAAEFYRSTEDLRQSGKLDLQLSQAANRSLRPRGITEERSDYRLHIVLLSPSLNYDTVEFEWFRHKAAAGRPVHTFFVPYRSNRIDRDVGDFCLPPTAKRIRFLPPEVKERAWDEIKNSLGATVSEILASH